MRRDMVVSRYAIPTGILCVNGLSTGLPGFGVSQKWRWIFVSKIYYFSRKKKGNVFFLKKNILIMLYSQILMLFDVF